MNICHCFYEKSEIGCGMFVKNTKYTELVQYENIRVSLHIEMFNGIYYIQQLIRL